MVIGNKIKVSCEQSYKKIICLYFCFLSLIQLKMGNQTNLCQAIDTPELFVKLGTSHEEIEKFQHNYPKIASIIDKKFTQEIQRTKQKYQPRKFIQGVYIGPVNDNNNPQTQNNQKAIFLYDQDGFFYYGQINNGKRSGDGFIVNQNGNFYSGQWHQNNPHGQGEYVSISPQRSYKGSWVDSFQQGKGEQTYEDGSQYEGQFFQGLKHGQGSLRYLDGTVYTGQFQQNKINGYGKSQNKFHKYDGEWLNGKMHGNGISTWTDEDGNIVASYIGQYKEGLKHGYGEYKWGEKKTYKGIWEDGDMKSQGVLLNYE